MGDHTGISWTDATWNPIVGCSVVSPGCMNCYAMKMAKRIETAQNAAQCAIGARKYSPYAGLTHDTKAGPVWNGKVAHASEEALTQPLRWKKSRWIFVNSMGDLFHESVPDAWIDAVFAIMALAPQHNFQVLTKRARRMREYCCDPSMPGRVQDIVDNMEPNGVWQFKGHEPLVIDDFPLRHLWLGVSAEDQERADERIPDLLATPATVRFVSAEPLLGAIDFRSISPNGVQIIDAFGGRSTDPDYSGWPRLDWVIVGGESGPGARRCWTPNVRSIVRQCKSATVPVFVKQLGANVQDRNDAGFDGENYDGAPLTKEWPDGTADRIEHDLDGHRDDCQGAPVRIRLRDRKGADMSEWPEDLRVQQFPQPPGEQP